MKEFRITKRVSIRFYELISKIKTDFISMSIGLRYRRIENKKTYGLDLWFFDVEVEIKERKES